jgi:hypothetical protein
MNFTHEANPVRVYARQIVKKIPVFGKDLPPTQHGWHFEFVEADTDKWCSFTDPMLARYVPEVGDYLVTQEDGYEYFNPKDVFERKYHSI